MIAPELMGHASIPHRWNRGCSFNMTSILQAGLIAGRKERKEGRQTVFFTPLHPFGDEGTTTVHGSLIRTPSTGSTWPGHKKRGLQFWQTRSHAIIVRDSVPADCIEKVVSVQGDKILFQRISTRHTIKHRETCRGAALRHPNRHSKNTNKHRELRAEGNPFKIDFRIQGNRQDAVLEDQGRTTKIQKLGGQAAI